MLTVMFWNENVLERLLTYLGARVFGPHNYRRNGKLRTSAQVASSFFSLSLSAPLANAPRSERMKALIKIYTSAKQPHGSAIPTR
jgi:hypothetical protein